MGTAIGHCYTSHRALGTAIMHHHQALDAWHDHQALTTIAVHRALTSASGRIGNETLPRGTRRHAMPAITATWLRVQDAANGHQAGTVTWHWALSTTTSALSITTGYRVSCAVTGYWVLDNIAGHQETGIGHSHLPQSPGWYFVLSRHRRCSSHTSSCSCVSIIKETRTINKEIK